MIFAYSTNAFVKFSLLDSITAIADLGFGGVEILADRPHLYPPDFSEAEMQNLRKALDEAGLKVTNLNSFTLFAVGDTYLPSWIEPLHRHINFDIWNNVFLDSSELFDCILHILFVSENLHLCPHEFC